MEVEDKYYIGRVFDPSGGQITDQPLLYDPGDLTTHAVVVGMTGSGKTGLCIDLFGVAWMPFHVLQVEDEVLELPGFGEG